MAVNMGKRNSIKTRVLKTNPSIFVNGCPCHIIQNTTSKAAEMLSRVSGFDVEDFLVDLFHWFDKSSKRKVRFYKPVWQAACYNLKEILNLCVNLEILSSNIDWLL